MSRYKPEEEGFSENPEHAKYYNSFRELNNRLVALSEKYRNIQQTLKTRVEEVKEKQEIKEEVISRLSDLSKLEQIRESGKAIPPDALGPDFFSMRPPETQQGVLREAQHILDRLRTMTAEINDSMAATGKVEDTVIEQSLLNFNHEIEDLEQRLKPLQANIDEA